MEYTKIAIIGAGAVGTTTAYALMLSDVAAEIMLVDINEVRCRGEILDLSDALSFYEASKIRGGTAQDARDAHIIIIAAGARQEPDQDRLELLKTNKRIITSVIESLKPINKEAIIIMISNPLDLLTLHAQEIADLPRNQIFGTGTYLDSKRLQGFLAQKLNVAEQSIQAYILGEHGDTQFPAWSCSDVEGVRLSQFGLDQKELDAIAQATKDKAYEIIACKGATFYGIAACVTSICESIVFDQKRALPLSVYVPEFDVCLSMPAVLGSKGIEKMLPIKLSDEEQKLLKTSAKKLRELKDA